MQWYYSNKGTQLGPVGRDELLAKIAAGEVTASDLVWREGMINWMPSGEVQELKVLLAPPRSHQAPVSGMAPVSPYAPPVYSGGSAAPARTSGLAIASLVCGILGLSCMLLPGIAAVICGHMALRQIADPASRLDGRGMAVAGLVTGYISVGILAIWAIFVVAGIVFGNFPTSR